MTPEYKSYHMCLDIRGIIRNKSFKGFTDDNGKPMSKDAVLSALMDELAKGRRVIPLGKCDNFDYQTGCNGHVQ